MSTSTKYAPTFDRASWTFGARRATAVAVTVAVSVTFLLLGEWWGTVLGVALMCEVVLTCLPWRIPRGDRSPWGFWAESLVALISPVAAVVCWWLVADDVLTDLGALYWYPVALIAGELMRRLHGPPLRAVLDGRVSFVLGPTPRSQSTARSVSTVVGGVGEEMLFRAPGILLAPSVGLTALCFMGFVARHHTQPGANGRGVAKTTWVEILAGVVLAALTIASGSLYPAVLAHLANNLPQAVAEARRSTDDDDDFFI